MKLRRYECWECGESFYVDEKTCTYCTYYCPFCGSDSAFREDSLVIDEAHYDE